jgi:hypothetical protein
MEESFLAAVIDTILPGEASAPAGTTPLPSGTRAGVALDANDPRHAAVLRLIAERSGTEDGFATTAPTERAAVLADVEKQSFEPFRALVAALLYDYYETPAVLGAIGWRSDAPQPQGYAVADADAATYALVDKVRARGPIWRDPRERRE